MSSSRTYTTNGKSSAAPNWLTPWERLVETLSAALVRASNFVARSPGSTPSATPGPKRTEALDAADETVHRPFRHSSVYAREHAYGVGLAATFGWIYLGTDGYWRVTGRGLLALDKGH